MIYTVKKIEEDIDFGCEERMENMPIMAVVTMVDEAGEAVTRKFVDQDLIDNDIQNGDRVIINEHGVLCKALDESWTKNFTAENVNVPKFTALLTAIKEGKEIEWVCPFCGEQVKRLEQENGHTVIGCVACDLRITLDSESTERS